MTVGRFSLLCALLVLWCGPAWAEDLNDPPWDLSLENQTSQAWECGQTSGFEDILPTVSDNAYGTATMTFTGGDVIEEIEGPRGVDVWTWHIGLGGGSVDIWVPNNPEENHKKMIFWQVTSDKKPGPASTNPPGVNLPPPYPQGMWPVDNWYTYNGLIQIVPNPEGEWIHFDFPESTNIEQIVIDTVCVVPEPATMGLMVLGLSVLVMRRRRA